MDHILQLHEFFVEGGNSELSHVLLHITEPSTPEERQKGYFFAIGEMDNAEAKYIAKLQETIDAIEQRYYETPENGDKPALETVLEQANQETYALIKPSVSLNCIIGAIRPPEIIFAHYGKPQMILFFKNRQGTYQKLDLLNGQGEEAGGEQLFSQIVQGKISPGDYLFAGTSRIADYFNHDRIQKIVTTRPTRQSAEHLERVLTELHDGFSFGGLIFHLSNTADIIPSVKRIKTPVKGASADSLHSLFNTERATADTLSPSLFPRLSSTLANFGAARDHRPQKIEPPAAATHAGTEAEIGAAHFHPARPRRKPADPALRARRSEQIAAILRLLFKAFSIFIRAIGWSLLAIYHLAQSLGRSLVLLGFAAANYQNRRATILENWRRGWRRQRDYFRQLPALTKITLAVSLIIGLIFFGSIIYLGHRQNTAAAMQAFTVAAEQIKTSSDAAESALLYHNETEALHQLQTARNLLLTLACDSKHRQNTCRELSERIENLLGQARKITIASALLLNNWDALPLEHLARLNNKLLIFSSTSPALASYDLLTKESAALPLGSAVRGVAGATAPKENDYLLLRFGASRFAKFNPADNNSSPIEISYPAENSVIAGNVIYNRRLYTLDTAHNQIYKHDSVKNGFDRGKEWLKDGAPDLKDGVDLTIDGDIFVLHATGAITKFVSGVAAPFTITGLDPALTGAERIWTYTDIAYLYILDGANRRLLVVNKDGQLQKQITAREFNHPADMIVDETNKTAYVLDGGKLFKINL